jgi:N6-adenosine-specific RNA methylase IME4
MIPFPDKKYQIIVVDPPWPIKKITRRMRPNQVKMDYSLMTLEQIRSLPVNKLATDKSYCFLWTTQKHLFIAKDILDSWGFARLLTMGWIKKYGKSSGMPLFGFRWNLEFIHVGIKGHLPALPKQKLIPAGFCAINYGHSKKPDEFYKAIEHLGTSRIDLFARKQREGWDVWGNEV